MKLSNGTKGNTDVKICDNVTKEIKHEIIYNMILHVDELTKEVQRQNWIYFIFLSNFIY